MSHAPEMRWWWMMVLVAVTACASSRPVAQEDELSIDSMLPKSGDPLRPNVKVEVSVVDVSSGDGLEIRPAGQVGFVQGVVDVKAALSAGAHDGVSRSQTASFIVVQSGGFGSITLSNDARAMCPFTGLEVHVLRANEREVELSLQPFSSTTTVEGERFQGQTQVTVRAGEALVLGGIQQQTDRSTVGTGGVSLGRVRRSLLALLLVKVIG